MQSSNDTLLTAREAAERLGIKLDTLYAYVSRGMMRSVRVPGSRERRYREEDVERFRLSRGERGGPVEALMPVIGSSICLIEDGRLYYRGRDAVRLADLEAIADEAARDRLLRSPDVLLADSPSITLASDDAARFLTGLRRRVDSADAALVRVYGPEPDAFLGTGHVRAGELIASRLLSPDEVGALLARRRMPSRESLPA